MDKLRANREEAFHDDWASSEDIEIIDVDLVNNAITSPELRWIHKELGDLRDKKVLDVGSGLGEFAVYAAKKGAEVVALDLSSKMLDRARVLAALNDVEIRTCHADADYAELGDEQFDVVYCGNLLHHVDIRKTVARLHKHVKIGGRFVSWDPLKYNPVVNLYRVLAAGVRTEDEHPLGVSDIRAITSLFGGGRVKYFWMATMIIFVMMAIIDRKHPSKHRFWKDVVYEQERWSFLYKLMKPIDNLACKIPLVQLLSWNVAMICVRIN